MIKPKLYMLMLISILTYIVYAAEPVVAQNFSGIIPMDERSGEVNTDAGHQEGMYSEVTLTSVNEGGRKYPYDPAMEPFMLDPSIIVESSNYTLGEKDVIEVIVARHPEVSGEYLINNEGKIQYEFVGDVKLEGLKKDEVKYLLTELLSEYIITPDVTVEIIGFNSKIVYVLGEVRKPGKVLLFGDTITVREALIQAGLPLETAKASKSRLITPSKDGQAKKVKVNIDKLLYEGDLRENHTMRPGDTLYIPPTVMAKTMRVIQPITAPINTVGNTGRRIYTGF